MQYLTVEQFEERLKGGPFSFPGCYPLYFITADGCALSFEAAEEQREQIVDAIKEPGTNDQWRVIGCEINWEDSDLYCDHTGKQIDSAYGED